MTAPAARGLLLGLVSACCYGFSGPLARMLIDAGLDPLQAVRLRLGAAAAVGAVCTLTGLACVVEVRHGLRADALGLLLGQALGPAQIAGGLVMLAGIVLAQRAVARLTAPDAREGRRRGRGGNAPPGTRAPVGASER
ncbi:hypothetical protein ACFVH6_33810 [Spirillospora sp. NPDC127200]